MHIGLSKRELLRTTVREMNVRAFSHQENLLLRCEGEGYAKTISF